MKKKKFNWKWAGALILFLLLIFYFVVYPRVRGISVVTYQITNGNAVDEYKEKGVLTSGESVKVLAKVSGTLDLILVQENETVKKGDVLLTIDSSDYERERDILNANLEALSAKKEEGDISRLMASSPEEYLASVKQNLSLAQTALAVSGEELTGKQALFDSGGISKLELDAAGTNYENALTAYQNAKNRYEQMNAYLKELEESGFTKEELNRRFYDSLDRQQEASLEALRGQIALLEEKIKDCRILAPEDGRVIGVPAKAQSLVMAGAPLIVLQPAGELFMEVEVLTDAVYYLETGASVDVEFSFRGNKKIIPGTIHKIYDFATEKISALGLPEYRVKLLVAFAEPPDAALSEGYQADVRFLLYSEENVITVPLSAVFEEGGSDYVFVIEGERARKREVSLSYKANTFFVVESGLSEGERIVSDASLEKLKEGVRIQ